MGKLKYRISALTHTGEVREHNEDNFIINPDLSDIKWQFEKGKYYSSSPIGSVWVVADGMGGANAGEVASEIAIQTVKQEFGLLKSAGLNAIDFGKFLNDVMKKANQNILMHSEQNPETKDMGTTLVIAWLLDDILHVSWVGDSRAYILRNSELNAVSKDHSLVQNLIDEGKITEDQAFYHPHNNVITQNLGQDPQELEPGYGKIRLLTGDKVLLCTDGLNGMLKDKDIERILLNNANIEVAVSKLLNTALEKGGYDNITIILSEIENHNSHGANSSSVKDKNPESKSKTSGKLMGVSRRKLKAGLVLIGLFIVGGIISFFGVQLYFTDDRSDDISALRLEADSLLVSGEYKAALLKFESLLSDLSSNDPRLDSVQEKIDHINNEEALVIENHYKHLVETGDRRLQMGRYPEAIKFYLEASELQTGASIHQDKLHHAKRLNKLPEMLRKLIVDTVHVMIDKQKLGFGKYEVTQAQWKKVMGTNPSFFSGCDFCPVENISLNEVYAFIDSLNQMSGLQFRLPSQEEWMIAARGSSSSNFSGSSGIDFIGWYESNSRGKTNPTGRKAPNRFGIYDMTGNVSEYVKSKKKREGAIVKGGSWNHPPEECKISFFETIPEQEKRNNVGFRLILVGKEDL